MLCTLYRLADADECTTYWTLPPPDLDADDPSADLGTCDSCASSVVKASLRLNRRNTFPALDYFSGRKERCMCVEVLRSFKCIKQHDASGTRTEPARDPEVAMACPQFQLTVLNSTFPQHNVQFLWSYLGTPALTSLKRSCLYHAEFTHTPTRKE